MSAECRCLLNAAGPYQTPPPLIACSQQSDIVSLHIVKLLYSHLYLAMYVALYLCAHPQHSRCERFSLNPWSAYAGCLRGQCVARMKGDCRIWYVMLLEKNGSCTSELLCWKREERDESSESECGVSGGGRVQRASSSPSSYTQWAKAVPRIVIRTESFMPLRRWRQRPRLAGRPRSR